MSELSVANPERAANNIKGQSTPVKNNLNETRCAQCLCNLCTCGTHTCSDAKIVPNRNTGIQMASSNQLKNPIENLTEYTQKFSEKNASFSKAEKIIQAENSQMITDSQYFNSNSGYKDQYKHPELGDYCQSRRTRKDIKPKAPNSVTLSTKSPTGNSYYSKNFQHKTAERPAQFRPNNDTKIVDLSTIDSLSGLETSMKSDYKAPSPSDYQKKIKHENKDTSDLVKEINVSSNCFETHYKNDFKGKRAEKIQNYAPSDESNLQQEAKYKTMLLEGSYNTSFQDKSALHEKIKSFAPSKKYDPSLIAGKVNLNNPEFTKQSTTYNDDFEKILDTKGCRPEPIKLKDNNIMMPAANDISKLHTSTYKDTYSKGLEGSDPVVRILKKDRSKRNPNNNNVVNSKNMDKTQYYSTTSAEYPVHKNFVKTDLCKKSNDTTQLVALNSTRDFTTVYKETCNVVKNAPNSQKLKPKAFTPPKNTNTLGKDSNGSYKSSYNYSFGALKAIEAQKRIDPKIKGMSHFSTDASLRNRDGSLNPQSVTNWWRKVEGNSKRFQPMPAHKCPVQYLKNQKAKFEDRGHKYFIKSH